MRTLRRCVAPVVASVALGLGCSAKSPSATEAHATVSGDTTVVTLPTGLSMAVPKSWKAQPTSAMRQAQWKLAAAEGDVEDADVTVFHFGAGQGGAVEANIERWYTQFQRPDGKSVKDSAKVEKSTANGLKLTTVDISGTFVAPVMPGSSEVNNKPGFRMRASVIEGDGGPWFVKLVGPEKTVAKHEPAFATLLATCKK